MSKSLNYKAEIEKFVKTICFLPEGESCESEIYKDVSVSINVKAISVGSKVDLLIIIKNPGSLLGNNIIGFPEEISGFCNKQPIQDVITNLFQEIKDNNSISRRKSFKFKKYNMKTNKAVYKTKIDK